MVNSSNSSDGIQNNLERYTWTSYFLFGLLSSLIGDTLILVASFQRQAFRISKFLVAIIQHIAVSDLANAIVFLLPTAISLTADSWILGDKVCYGLFYIGQSLYPTGMFLIAVLTTSKLLILRYPLRVASWSRKRAHQVGTFIWFSSLTCPLIFLLVDKDDVYFDYRTYNCDYRYTADVWKEILPVVFFIYGVVPSICIVATTILTLKYLADAGQSARQVRGSVPRQGTFTVVTTAVVYCISTLPYFLLQIAGIFVKEHSSHSLYVISHRVTYFLLMINIISNFYIYTLTIKSFRKFLCSKVFTLASVSRLSSRKITRSATGEEQGFV